MSNTIDQRYRGLGRRQQAVLKHLNGLRAELLRITARGVAKRVVEQGVPWWIRGTPTRRASCSRALATLELRGLVVRTKGPLGKRTVAVQLRPACLSEVSFCESSC
jgi:hypothetical protein